MTTTHSYGTGVYQMLAYVSRYSLWSPPNSAPIVQRSEELTGLVRPSLGIVVFALLASSFLYLVLCTFSNSKEISFVVFLLRSF